MMKRTVAYLAAVVSLFWAAGGRAQNLPDDAISAERPLLRIPASGRRPNSLVKLSVNLPLNDFDLSGHRPKDFLRISAELPYGDLRQAAGFRPNSLVKLSAFRPELVDNDVARYGFDPHVTLSGHLPYSFLKISSQYPSSNGN
jgi:hypothetical protein